MLYKKKVKLMLRKNFELKGILPKCLVFADGKGYSNMSNNCNFIVLSVKLLGCLCQKYIFKIDIICLQLFNVMHYDKTHGWNCFPVPYIH